VSSITLENGQTQLEKDLAALCKGGVRFDAFARALYSTDASIYQIPPLGVVFPKDEEDVIRVVEYASSRKIPILPRGGGSGLAGQTVCEAIVLDFTRHMRNVLDFNPDAKTIRVQPGIVLDELNRFLKPHNLKFAPDPASSAQAAIGGMIGNNSTGGRSLIYGKTDYYLRSLRLVLSSGNVIQTRPVRISEIDRLESEEARSIHRKVSDLLSENADEISQRYPKLKRNVGGYNLPHVIQDDRIDLAKLIAGSEGTLAVVTEAELDLVSIPKASSLVLLCYRDLMPALESVTKILELGPSATELVDEVFLDLASKVQVYRDLVLQLPSGTKAILLVEFCGDEQALVDAKVAELVQKVVGEKNFAFTSRIAKNAQERDNLWALRKAALPILAGQVGDLKYVEFIEDATVPPEHLPAYVQDFKNILKKYDTSASFYAHAGPGCLHVRPMLNLKKQEDIEKMYQLGNDVTDAVVKYHGAISGEHGDGLSKTQWNRKMYGPRIWELFKQVKKTFDPEGIMNPGKICSDETDLRNNLREGPDKPRVHFDTMLDFSDKIDLVQAVELCNGCGGCRNLQGGTMCPSYRGSGDENLTTRGRANMLRNAIYGILPQDTLYSEKFRKEVLDLCLGCKACARECPSGVDLAKLKMEVLHQYHQRHGLSLRDRMLISVRTANILGSMFAPLSDWMRDFPLSRWFMEKVAGIDRRRKLPAFEADTFESWFHRRPSSAASDKHKVVLFVDCFTNHHETRIPKAAVEVLEACGVEVKVVKHGCCGRTMLSQGILDHAKATALSTIDDLIPWVRKGYEIVGCEPSCMTSLQEDYISLVRTDEAKLLAEHSFEIMEYLAGPAKEVLEKTLGKKGGDKKRVAYHGHCHQKAMGREKFAAEALACVPGMEVTQLDTGCCGMAGVFGYEKAHYDLSMNIAQDLFKKAKSHGGEIVATGFSCRCQIGDGMQAQAKHPVEVLAEALQK
jgi:FAD/FMN-containing dehydrogenase/Fe-S oxidoreductase